MSAHLIDGQAYADELTETTARDVAHQLTHGIRPCLATLRIGDDHTAAVYERRLRILADTVGCHHIAASLPLDITTCDATAAVERLSDDPRISGVLLLRPTPPNVDDNAMRDALDPAKDIEAVHPVNAGLLSQGRPRYVPSTPAAAFHLLNRYLTDTGRDPATTYEHSNLVIIGRSDNVGKPATLLALALGATVTSCDVHSHRAGLLTEHTRNADILIVAAGVPGLITSDHVKDGAIILDIGINPVKTNGRTHLVGDVAASTRTKAEAVTPVPGGIGPITDLLLLQNVIRAAGQLRGGSPTGPRQSFEGNQPRGDIS